MSYYQTTSGGRTYTKVNYYTYKWIRFDGTISWSSASGLAGVFGPVLNSSRFDNIRSSKWIGTPTSGTSYTQNLSWSADYVATDGSDYQCANSTITLHHGGSTWSLNHDNLCKGVAGL